MPRNVLSQDGYVLASSRKQLGMRRSYLHNNKSHAYNYFILVEKARPRLLDLSLSISLSKTNSAVLAQFRQFEVRKCFFGSLVVQLAWFA